MNSCACLYLSGTPFRAISSGEFIEEQIYNWTYSDEQGEFDEFDLNEFFSAEDETFEHTEPIVEVPDCSIEVSTTTGIIEDTPTHDGVSESPMTSDETVAVKSRTELTIGDTVTHKSLGPGTIMSFNEKYIIIKFRDRESKFFYPGAFEKGYFE